MFSTEIPIVTTFLRTCVFKTCGLCLLAVSWTLFNTLDNMFSYKSFKNYSNIFLKTALRASAQTLTHPVTGSQSWVISKVDGHVSNPLLSIDLPNMIIWWNINCSWFWIFRSCPMFCRFDTQLYVVLNHNCIKKLVKPKCYPSNFSS